MEVLVLPLVLCSQPRGHSQTEVCPETPTIISPRRRSQMLLSCTSTSLRARRLLFSKENSQAEKKGGGFEGCVFPPDEVEEICSAERQSSASATCYAGLWTRNETGSKTVLLISA